MLPLLDLNGGLARHSWPNSQPRHAVPVSALLEELPKAIDAGAEPVFMRVGVAKELQLSPECIEELSTLFRLLRWSTSHHS